MSLGRVKRIFGLSSGWFRLSRVNLERWLYALHRVTGVIVGVYLIAHVIETSNSLLGPEYWNDLMEFLRNPAAHTGLLIVVAASVYHSLNGVRLFLASLGVGLGRPIKPEYPYVPVSLSSSQRRAAWLILVATAVLTAYAFYHLFLVSLWGWA